MNYSLLKLSRRAWRSASASEMGVAPPPPPPAAAAVGVAILPPAAAIELDALGSPDN